jgi:transketolase
MKSTRQAFGESLAFLAQKHAHIVVLDADLSKSTKSDLFAKKFPDRFFEMGIAEANMIGTAAGLSFNGKLPFACSFACFLTGRFDTIRMSVAYSQANVRLIGTHAGVGIGDDGHSQMGLEDIALMRSLPGMTIFQPMDAHETEKIMTYLVEKHQGPVYLRLTRQNLPVSPFSHPFDPFCLDVLIDTPQPQAVVIGTGAVVHEALLAQKSLAQKKIAIKVVNAKCLKPFDKKGLLSLLKTDLLVSVEDHSVLGGLGSIIAEILAEQNTHPRLIRLGIQDQFGESGDPEKLYEKHGISAHQIEKTVLSALAK